MTPAEYILYHGKCRYCETPITDNDRCGCDRELIWYLTQAVDLLSEAISPLSGLYDVLKDSDGYIWKIPGHPGLSINDAKKAKETIEWVEGNL